MEKVQKWRKKKSVLTNHAVISEEGGPGSYVGTALSETTVVLETQREKLAYRKGLECFSEALYTHTHTIDR